MTTYTEAQLGAAHTLTMKLANHLKTYPLRNTELNNKLVDMCHTASDVQVFEAHAAALITFRNYTKKHMDMVGRLGILIAVEDFIEEN